MPAALLAPALVPELDIAPDAPAAPPVAPLPMPVPPEAAVPPGEPVAEPPLMPDPLVVPLAPDPPASPGCMAGEPDVVEPEPVAVGRSAEGTVVFCASAGAAIRADASRHAVICVLSMKI